LYDHLENELEQRLLFSRLMLHRQALSGNLTVLWTYLDSDRVTPMVSRHHTRRSAPTHWIQNDVPRSGKAENNIFCEFIGKGCRMLQFQTIAFRVAGCVSPYRTSAFQRIDRFGGDALESSIGQAIRP
jgi:hypothetical protein